MDKVKQHFVERMNNYQAYRVYCQMIRHNEIEVVKNLYDNLNKHVSDHPKYPALLELFKERIPEYVG